MAVTEKSIVEQLRPIFEPKSVAVIGASNDITKFGGRAFLSPMESGYRGALYPVNPNRNEIAGVKTYPSILDVPGDVDLAVISIFASMVPQVMEECVQKGVKGAVMLTAGFAEASEEGKSLQDKVVSIAHRGGIRFVGPNCMGITNSVAKLNLVFPVATRPGPISFISQSGTMGIYLFQVAMSKGYGFSKFVSSGNQASIDMADYLEYLAQDENTKAIVLYIEGVQKGRRFFEVAKEVVKQKPILVYKGGQSPAGSRATLSHTASLSGSDEVFNAACNQAGIIRCSEVIHPFEMAEALINQPMPKGKRVAILGSGGQCVASADACARLGLELPELDQDTKNRIKEILAPHAPVPSNPVDTAMTPDPRLTSKLLEILASLDYIDGMISPGVFGMGSQTPDQIRNMLAEVEAVAAIPQKYSKPLVLTGMILLPNDMAINIFRGAGIPIYITPEESARAMYGLMRYGEIRRQLEEC